MKNYNNDLEEAKKANAQSKQGMTNSTAVNSTGYDSPATQEARQMNKKTGKSGYVNSAAFNSTGYDSMGTQQARQLNNQSAQGAFAGTAGMDSTGYDSPDTQEARQFNNKSSQGGFTNSMASSFGSNVNPLDEAKNLNKKSGRNKK